MNFFLLKEYIRYFHFKTDEHSLHSPFFYQFYRKLIKDKSYHESWYSIEKNRADLLNSESSIPILDLGAGSKVENASERKLRSIAKHSLSTPRFSQFLFRLIQKFNFRNIIELGTSLGINTSYLAQANSTATINTFEADPNALKIAQQINGSLENIQYHHGDIANLLPTMLPESTQAFDLVYADANHTYAASIQYFDLIVPFLSNTSIYILDDIHWSAGMKKAWKELKNRTEVTSSIDLFDAGILFFNPDFKKQHYILDF